MPANIEIKARLRDFPRTLSLAREISDVPLQILDQEDTFFQVPRGRLKLRVINSLSAELIHYERPDQSRPKQSNYRIFPTKEPILLNALLTDALGIQGIVKKRRHLFLLGQTRIHLDEVETLGFFMELEYVLRTGEPAEDGMKSVREIMKRLEIIEEDLISCAYLDLLSKT